MFNGFGGMMNWSGPASLPQLPQQAQPAQGNPFMQRPGMFNGQQNMGMQRAAPQGLLGMSQASNPYGQPTPFQSGGGNYRMADGSPVPQVAGSGNLGPMDLNAYRNSWMGAAGMNQAGSMGAPNPYGQPTPFQAGGGNFRMADGSAIPQVAGSGALGPMDYNAYRNSYMNAAGINPAQQTTQTQPSIVNGQINYAGLGR